MISDLKINKINNKLMEQFHKLLILYSKNININSFYNKGQNYNFINKCILQSRF